MAITIQHYRSLKISNEQEVKKEAYTDSILLPLHCQYLQTCIIPLYMTLPNQHCQTIKWMAPYSNSSQIVTRNTAAVSYLWTIRNSHLSCGLVCRPGLDRTTDAKWQQTRHVSSSRPTTVNVDKPDFPRMTSTSVRDDLVIGSFWKIHTCKLQTLKHRQPFNGLFPGTIWVSWHRKRLN